MTAPIYMHVYVQEALEWLAHLPELEGKMTTEQMRSDCCENGL